MKMLARMKITLQVEDELDINIDDCTSLECITGQMLKALKGEPESYANYMM